ncbi:MAG: hypothetical protein GTO45_40285 [Candidatus Aminicenantes bacterium]|nr:hypothetical protein [Candidatus Aminicenantes bacterium]NIM84853.1 hypothetical protein [Candidatus Aminicenantes bacterium]NIN24361.1 hypothetical protein [Candidatus Aminicenantes bacterium]NIN48125.1 hypothetical protein [Candidatus Aminicenantes bacterium]NIN91023.1 hypothetical protein [Candidatus Aminicenantes bacterium]
MFPGIEERISGTLPISIVTFQYDLKCRLKGGRGDLTGSKENGCNESLRWFDSLK